MEQSRFIFIESNTSGTGRDFAHVASDFGFNPLVFAEDPDRYPYLLSDGISYLRVSTSDRSALVRELNQLQQAAAIGGIYSTSDHFIATASELAHLYGSRAADPHAIRRCRDKYRQRTQLQAAGITVPKFWRVCSERELEKIASELPCPAVVKPVTGTGSVDVRLCSTRAEIGQEARKLLARTTNERGLIVTPECLIEEYVAGPEYSVEIFNDSVIGITRKHLSPEPYFVETGHDFPAVLPTAVSQTIDAVASMAVTALGLGFGPVHTELRYSPERGPVIIEVNPRLAGGFIPSLVRIATGVDVIRATVALLSGREIDLMPKVARFASIRFIVAETEGMLEGLEGIEKAKEIPDIAEARAYRAPGDSIQIHHDFRDRIGHVIATGATADAAVVAACAAVSHIRIAMRPFENQ